MPGSWVSSSTDAVLMLILPSGASFFDEWRPFLPPFSDSSPVGSAVSSGVLSGAAETSADSVIGAISSVFLPHPHRSSTPTRPKDRNENRCMIRLLSVVRLQSRRLHTIAFSVRKHKDGSLFVRAVYLGADFLEPLERRGVGVAEGIVGTDRDDGGLRPDLVQKDRRGRRLAAVMPDFQDVRLEGLPPAERAGFLRVFFGVAGK